MANRTCNYTARVSKALALYERLLEATGERSHFLAWQIKERLAQMDVTEREAYYRHAEILRRSRDLRLKDAARAPRG